MVFLPDIGNFPEEKRERFIREVMTRMGDKIIVTGKNSERDYIFRPSEQLSFYLYQIYLQVASCQELENDTLDVQTHWKLIENISENDKGYEVFWDNNIAVTRDPAEENNKYKYDSSTGKFTIPKKNKSISSNSYMVWDEKENVWTTKENQRIEQEINDRIQMYGKSERYFNPDDPNDPFNGAIDLTKGNIPYDY